MNTLRVNRNDDYHYIFKDDSVNVILCKEKALYDVLKNLDDAKRQLLNKKISALLIF